MAFVAAPAPAEDPLPAEGDDAEQHRAAADEASSAAGSSCCSELSEGALMAAQHRASLAHSQASAGEASAAAGSCDGASDDGSSARPDLVLAAGWSRAVCVWEEGGERVASAPHRRLGGHATDILCLAPLGPDIAATGGLRGWWEGTREGLAGAASGAPLHIWHLLHPLSPTPPPPTPHPHQGDFDGAVRLWHLPSAACLAAFACGGPQWERAVRKLCWLPATDARAAPMLVACCEDGSMQFWGVQLPAELGSGGTAGAAAEPCGADRAAGTEAGAAAGEQPPQLPVAACTLVARIAAAHRRQDCITAVCASSSADGAPQLWTGDSSGHVALWDAAPLCSAAPAASEAEPGSDDARPAGLGLDRLPRRTLIWRAAEAAVVSLDALTPGRGLLLVGAQDASVAVWTQGGGLVGRFGRDSWDLAAPATWRDPQAAARPPPLPEDDGAGSGLTPREVIAATPRRCSWGVRSTGGRGSARPSAQLSARGEPSPSAASGSVAASAGQTAAGEHNLDAVADTLASIARLRLPRCTEDGPAPAGSTAAAAAVPKPPTVAAPSPQLLPADSAGARLSAMAAQAAAAKAGRWDVPVHVQAHSALALQPLDAVLGSLPGG